MDTQHSVQSEVYLTSDGRVEVDVRRDGETVWLNRQQLAMLFARDVKTIGKHITNAQREELDGFSVVAKFATTATDGKIYQVEHYNLDMVLSVGYRVKSREGVHFRRWANGVLKRYIIDGAALNEQRLEQLGQVVQILARSNDEVLAGVTDVLAQYLPGLVLLRDYDAAHLDPAPQVVPGWELTLNEAREVIASVADEFPDDAMLGRERGGGLAGVIATIYQGFGGQELYPTVEEKAANLLYLIVKDHPLSDGNKRSAAALFVTFLARNGLLYHEDRAGRITNNALAAMTLMVAMSDPKEKDLMIALIIRMLTAKN